MYELTTAEELAYGTVRILCKSIDNNYSTGTGFFYALPYGLNDHIPVMVTNKHVVVNATTGHFVLTLRDDKGMPKVGDCQRFELTEFAERWIPHPNPAVDLCVMPIAPLINDVDFFYRQFDESLMPTQSDIDDMIGLETITMVGYPNGLWDEVNNQPIFRKGVLATNYKHDWNGKKEFLIDAACFPGSSGSPVMLLDTGMVQTRRGNSFGSTRLKLLGILWGGMQHTVTGKIVVRPITTQQEVISEAHIPINLGIIIKSELLRDFVPLLHTLATT